MGSGDLGRVFAQLIITYTRTCLSLFVFKHFNLHFQMVLVLNHSFHYFLMLLLTLQAHILFSLQLCKHLLDETLLITAHLFHNFSSRAHIYLLRLLPLNKTIYFIEKILKLRGCKFAFSVDLDLCTFILM